MIELTQTMNAFITYWGEMGPKWGINRTEAQIHALLFISSEPLNAEEIQSLLQVARSNVSTSLAELQNWGLVRSIKVLGERKCKYESIKDIWQILRIIIEQRKKREIDSALQILHQCSMQADATTLGPNKDEEYARGQIKEYLHLFETLARLSDRLKAFTPEQIKEFADTNKAQI